MFIYLIVIEKRKRMQMQDGKSSYIHPVEEVGLAVLAPERLMRCIQFQSNPTEECQSIKWMQGEETINK
jgi:hypothetical protein